MGTHRIGINCQWTHPFGGILNGSSLTSKYIKGLKTFICTLDPIPSKLIEDYLPVICPLVTDILNISFSSGSDPQIACHHTHHQRTWSPPWQPKSWNVLLCQLESSLHINGAALSWFHSYLTNWHQLISLNNCTHCSLPPCHKVSPRGLCSVPFYSRSTCSPLARSSVNTGSSFIVMPKTSSSTSPLMPLPTPPLWRSLIDPLMQTNYH